MIGESQSAEPENREEQMLPVRRRRASWAACALLVGAVVAAIAYGRVPQPPEYHDFADGRGAWGIPNAADVLSNVAFLVVGIVGLRIAVRDRRAGDSPRPGHERAGFLLYCVGIALTAAGSVAYHLNPSDATLVWDRLPMSLAFTAFFALVLGERLGPAVGRWSLAPILLVGVGSVGHWAWTLQDAPGGDLRAYLLVKFGSAAAVILLILLVPEPRRTRSPIVKAIVALGVATGLELADRVVFRATAGLVSGHTLKHLAAAAAAGCFLPWFRR